MTAAGHGAPRVRIAAGGIRHETNTFSTLRTRLADFQVLRGAEIDFPNDQGIEVAGTLVASAFPHGPVQRAAYQSLKAELLDRLRAVLPVDGVLLRQHGAMEVDGLGDGEGDLARAVREIVGPQVPVAATLDLHGNISPALVQACDVLTALRTAPHRDDAETRARAFAHLRRCVTEGRRPVVAMAKPPILIAGESAVTDVEPARSLYALLPQIEQRPGVLDASIMIGCAWADTPRTSTAALVVAWEREVAEREACLLAEDIWRRRADFAPEAETAPLVDGVQRALGAAARPVFLSDSGDNVTAGGAGDLTLVLAELLRVGARDALVAGLADTAAVEQCHAAGVGAEVQLALGGKLDTINGGPLPVQATVLHAAPGLARLRCAGGGVEVIVAADRRAFTTVAGIAAAGADARAYQVVVVKQGYLFPELRTVAARSILALTPGFTDLDLPRLPFRRVPRPIFPLDPDATYQASTLSD